MSNPVVSDVEKVRASCPSCKKTFADQNALYQHANAKHGAKVARPLRPERSDDYEPSMAELEIEARLARAMGEPVEDWIADMFDV